MTQRCECLARLGAEIVTPDLPCRFARLHRVDRPDHRRRGIFPGRRTGRRYEPADRRRGAPAHRGRAEGFRRADYLAALHDREEAKQIFAAAIAGVDALLTPTTQTPAIPLAAVDQATTPAHFTRFVNLLDLCALALPNGFTASGLPLSLQIVCRGYDEATALRIGWAYQQATDWHERRPPGIV